MSRQGALLVLHPDAREGAIRALSVYCTGDGDVPQRVRHALAVKLPRP